MGEWGEKGSEELFILFVCSKSFFPTPVGKDKCVQLLEPEVAEFRMDLNGLIIIVSWELIRPHNLMICSAGEVNRENKHPIETMVVTYLATATAVPWLLLPLGSWVQYVWREPSKSTREVLEVLSASGLDCKADNLVLSFKMPSLFLLFIRATVFSWHPNCFGGFASLHWPPISNTGGRWISKMKVITL